MNPIPDPCSTPVITMLVLDMRRAIISQRGANQMLSTPQRTIVLISDSPATCPSEVTVAEHTIRSGGGRIMAPIGYGPEPFD